MAYLVLVRHTESVWNKKGLWTGWTDIDLDEVGKNAARKVGSMLKDISFNLYFTSPLKRAKNTLVGILEELEKGDQQILENDALKERNYGEFTGKNKWEIREKIGEEEFLRIRRGWDVPIWNGESLKDVYQRVVPFYEEQILPKLKEGKNILIVSHGNNLRALVKYLENITDSDIPNLEISTGEIIIYQMDTNGKILSKQIKKC
ncbi:MAG: 2,3-diphosphoglycerate-dependent phosphoglycerate mutase [Candidatus Daviesbacteria bacterium]|nr:2,3-diphosphoglycerate-dependent phosphoglycerate mutase [Candidatus Daviesbacteria bacterium]